MKRPIDEEIDEPRVCLVVAVFQIKETSSNMFSTAADTNVGCHKPSSLERHCEQGTIEISAVEVISQKTDLFPMPTTEKDSHEADIERYLVEQAKTYTSYDPP